MNHHPKLKQAFNTSNKLGDIIWIGITVLLVISSYLFFWTNGQTRLQGHSADIIVNHKTVKRISLHVDKRYRIKGPLGYSVIEVHKRRVRFTKSPCTHKYCVRSGWHQLAHDTAACVPNDIVLRINGAPTGYDVLNY